MEKCLAAGFEHVVFVSTSQDALDEARKTITAALAGDQIKCVRFLRPEQLFQFLAVMQAKGTAKSKSAAEAAEKEVLTAKELEALLKIDVKTIYSVQRGLLPYVRIQSNLRFEILQWVEEHRFRPKSPGSRK